MRDARGHAEVGVLLVLAMLAGSGGGVAAGAAARTVAAAAVKGAIVQSSMVTHSGAVVSIEPGAARLVLDEVGPWRVRDGVTQLTRRTIELTKATTYVTSRRVKGAASGFAGDFVEREIAAADIRAGSFVTIECEHRGPRMIALKVILVESEP
jgi:hypothetical protein